MKEYPENFIKFLGTAGARFVVIYQLRYSGGLWIRYNNANIIVDPGPGALTRIRRSKPELDPTKLDFMIITHRHIDHTTDANIIAEAMTNGGFTKKGTLITTADSLDSEPIIFSAIRRNLDDILFWEENIFRFEHFNIKGLKLIHHGVECFGFKLFKDGLPSITLVSDTVYFDDLPSKIEETDILILNLTMYNKRRVDHLCVKDVVKLLNVVKPKQITLLTHFGRGILRHGPDNVAKEIAFKTTTNVKAAYDGMTVDIMHVL